MSAMMLRGSSRAEPGLLLAGALAFLVHMVFVAIMIYGLNWKTYPPEGMIVDIWSDLPQLDEPLPSPSPSPPQKVETPEPEPTSEPDKTVTINTPSPPRKPDIAFKEKPEQPKEEDSKEKEKKREKEKSEAERLQREQAEQQKREQEAQQAAQVAAQARLTSEIAKYKAMILAKIKSRIVMPPDLPGNPMVEFGVTLLPGGDVLDVRLRQSSGFAIFDDAVERAIFLAKPLPVPPDPAMFTHFRELGITFNYQEVLL